MPERSTIDPMARETNTRSFVLRVDAATMEALEAWAEDEFRSINGQLQWIIADALRRSGRLKKSRPQTAVPMHRRTRGRICRPCRREPQTNPDHERKSL